jgi:ATP-dependent RNA helicase RhlE
MTTPKQLHKSTTFHELGLHPKLLKSLDAQNITTPTAIQHQAIPLGVEGKDIIGIAQTGTGKTFGFGLPMLHRLANSNGRGLVVVPTRELAYQVEESLRSFAGAVGIKTAVFVGGTPINGQRRALKRNPRLLIATPGRLNDHLEQGFITLKEVTVLVLDEADRMLDMGFKPQINKILAHMPKRRQMLLFSATMPQAIFTLAKKEMKLPLRIEVAPEGTTAEKVEQELIVVPRDKKNDVLLTLLKDYSGPVLVFSRTKYGAKKINRTLNNMGHRAAEIHGNRSLAQRRAALAGFKSGKFKVLVATDIAARGIDVDNIELVVNYDLPDDSADYVHRIGRTGRAGKSGKAISFASPNQMRNVRDIEKLIRNKLPRKTVSVAKTTSSAKPKKRFDEQDDRRSRSRDEDRSGRGPRRNNRRKPGKRRDDRPNEQQSEGTRTPFKKGGARKPGQRGSSGSFKKRRQSGGDSNTESKDGSKRRFRRNRKSRR